MNRPLRPLAAGTVALLLLAAPAFAVPVITNVTPAKGPSNTGATVTVSCTDCGYSNDRVYFPGTSNWVNPTAWTLNTSVTVRVPATWSGDVQLQKQGTGALSNPFPHEISYAWSGNKWPAFPFTWFLNTAGAPGLTFDQTRDEIIGANVTWECASGAGVSYGGSTALAVSSQDGTNCRYWKNSGWVPGTVAVTTVWAVAGNIQESDIAFNSQHYTWSRFGAAGSMDVRNIATHETGHTFGLLDLYGAADDQETMYGLFALGETSKRTLNADDVFGIEFLHPHTRPNLTSKIHAGWSSAMVPRSTNDATSMSATLTPTLPGNASTYMNLGMTNNGSDCAGWEGHHSLKVDGVQAWDLSWLGTWVPGLDYAFLNFQTTVRGGRHTLKLEIDAINSVLETNESDNTVQAQYVWSPFVLPGSPWALRLAPPENGPYAAHNCDGFEYTSTGYWGGIAMLPQMLNDDYDVELFNDYAGSTTGFSTPLALSYSGGSSADFVLWNGNVGTVGFGAKRYAGVTQYEPGTSDFGWAQVDAQTEIATLYPTATYGAPEQIFSTLLWSEVFKIVEVYLGSTSTRYSFEIFSDGSVADLDVNLYPANVAHLHKNSSVAGSHTIGVGLKESFTYQPPVAGYYAVVVYKRDASGFNLDGGFTLRVGPELPDFLADFYQAQWDAPVVPRNSNTGVTTAICHITPTLDGNVSNTWFNQTIRQLSTNPAPAVLNRVYLDETQVVIDTGTAPDLSGNINWVVNNAGPHVVRGGRHSVTNAADYLDDALETNEANNVWADQFVWSPLPLSAGTPVVRSKPPAEGLYAHPNADGFQFDRIPGFAWVAACAPLTPLDDYDLYVYDDYVGSTSGFSNQRRVSFYGPSATEFVVGNYVSSPSTFYPAVVHYSSAGGGGDFAADQITSLDRVAFAQASFVNQSLPAHRLADVYELGLDDGETVSIALHRLSGTDDIRFEVFAPTLGELFGRGDGLGSLVASPDLDTLTYTAVDSGWHELVVFRGDGHEAGTALTYSLLWAPGATLDVPADTPTELAFSGAAPNPVMDRARFSFALPRESGASLEIFDLNGRRIRTLLDGRFGPGHHEAMWDRRDDQGNRAGAGIYWARLRADGRTLTKRVSVLR